MKLLPAILLAASLSPCLGLAAEMNLATLSCEKYENDILPNAVSEPVADPINIVMWLFGYSVARSGAHVLYADALTAFGFALDGECKSNPRESVLDALSVVKPETKSPMDLTTLECAPFASRHNELARSDPESSTTIMMWLLGFSTAKSGSHIFNADLLNPFQTSLLAQCGKQPKMSLFDALNTLKPSRPAK